MHVSPQVLHKTPQDMARFFHAGSYEAPKDRNFPPHSHQMWELVYYRSGHIGCPVGDEWYESQPGMLLLTPPGVVHAEYAWTAYSNFFITMEAPPDHPWPCVVLDDEHRTVGTVCRQMVQEYGGRGAERADMLAALTCQLDIVLRRSEAQHQLSSRDRLVRKVEGLLEERFSFPVVIKDIAREVGVSPSYLRAQFVQLRGDTPMARLQAIRAQRALAMLRNSDLTLEVIASLCGYCSASHLSRQIKRLAGQSPGALRWR